MSRSSASSARAIRSPIAALDDRRHGDAGQDQRHRLRSALVAGEPVDGERGDDAAGEGGQLQAGRHGSAEPEHDRRHGAERRAARDADQARIGQRVPEDALQRCAGDAERPSDECAEEDSRQPDDPEDGVVLRVDGRRRCRRRDGGAGSRSRRPGRSQTAPTPTPSRSAAASSASRPGEERCGPDEPARSNSVTATCGDLHQALPELRVQPADQLPQSRSRCAARARAGARRRSGSPAGSCPRASARLPGSAAGPRFLRPTGAPAWERG